jgi:hypothetical protein
MLSVRRTFIDLKAVLRRCLHVSKPKQANRNASERVAAEVADAEDSEVGE